MAEEGSNKTGDYDPDNPRFNQEQYDMLMRCSEKGDMTEWNEWRKKNTEEEIWLEGANIAKARRVNDTQEVFHMAYLKDAILDKAHLEGADLRGSRLQSAFLNHAHLEKANLMNVHLEGATLHSANLEDTNFLAASLNNADFMFANFNGAILNSANLKDAKLFSARLQGTCLLEASIEGASFEKAIVDDSTFLWKCKVNRRSTRQEGTNFIGVGLDRLRIDPATKQLLEYNVRRRNWDEWYRGYSGKKWMERGCKFITSPVRLFWFVSDYGISTSRILLTFFVLAIAFAFVYFLCPDCVMVNNVVGDIRGFVHALYFSVVTMTTLGFGDIAANPDSWVGQVVLMIQVILGYALLGALVTRFAVLFISGGPAGEFAPMDEERKTVEGK